MCTLKFSRIVKSTIDGPLVSLLVLLVRESVTMIDVIAELMEMILFSNL